MDLKTAVRSIPDFPKPGILFRDVTTLFQDPEAFRQLIDELAKSLEGKQVDLVVGPEGRGFVVGSALAYALNAGLVLARKPGKLPCESLRYEYALEYGTDSLEIHVGAIKPGQKVVVVDDLLATGGTIASVRTQQGLKPVLSSEELLAHLPELKELCCPETLALCSIDSTDLGQEHWLMMARAIQENYALYDGFIICHGTDTLAYSAAALSYLIQNADKPIILTGAQQPISNEITDAKKNLRDSVVCAIDPGSRGVMVVFGGHVIAGTRAKKNKTISYDAFASVNFPELALVQGDRLVRYIPSPWPTGPVEFSRTLDSRVFLLKLTPGMSPALIPEIFRLYDCVIVESFGVGGIPQQLMDAFAAGLGDYETTHKVLIMTTQVTYEGSDVGVYEVGKRVRNRFRFLEAHDMTIEAVVTKSMWLLAENCESFDQLQQRFYRQVNFDTFYH